MIEDEPNFSENQELQQAEKEENGTTPLSENIDQTEEESQIESTPENYTLIEENNENDQQEQEQSNVPEQTEPEKLFDVTQPPEVSTVQPKQEGASENSSSSEEFDNELDKAIDQLVNRFTPPPIEMRSQIMQLIERRRVEALVDGDYDMAEQQDKIAGILNMVISSEQQKANEDRTIDMLYGRWQQLTQKQNQITAKWDKKIQDFINETDQQKLDLEKTHEEEIDNFLIKWKDPTFLRPFNKPSSRLLQLREQEKAMAISRMYSQAKEMKAVADRLQREETQQAQAKISATMAMERNKLAIKQNKEMTAWSTYRSRMIKSMQADKQKELNPTLTAMKQIKAKKTSPNKLPSSLPTLPNARSESAQSEQSCNNYSPRTQAMYSHFRSEKKTTLLDVAPVDDQTLLQMKKPTTARSRSGIATRGPTVKRTPVSKRFPNRK